MHINYLNLPNPPDNLLESIEQILQKPKRQFQSGMATGYIGQFRSVEIDEPLRDWLKTIFNFKFNVQYQIIQDDVLLHKDKRQYAFNYLLSTGGDNVKTSIYDDDKNLIESVTIQPKTWHSIETHYYHDVQNIENGKVRVALSVTPLI